MIDPAAESFALGIEPDPNIDMVEWADKFRYLPQESSKEYGLFRTSTTPYLAEIMRELSPQSKTQKVAFMKCTQIGASELGNNLLFFVAALFPAPCMWAMPTGALAERHSKKKIATSLKYMPSLQDKILDAKSRNSGNTIKMKEFPGGSWTFTGADAPTQARSDSIKILILDDYDGMGANAGDEGATGDLFCKRTDTFGDSKKIYINSTPTVRGASNIETEYLNSSQAKYNVPCPECNEMFELSWGYIKFVKAKLEEKTIYMECPHCKAHIREYQKTKMMADGVWVHRFPENSTKGYTINSFYSPMGMVSWFQIVEEFLAAQGNVEKLKVWNNTRMAQTFEQAGDRPAWAQLRARSESYEPMTVPEGVKLLTAGIDTHGDRLDIVIRGWNFEEESWLIYWGQLWGDPSRGEVWKQLDLLLNYNYKKVSGSILKLRFVSIDAMGNKTQEVKNYCRTRYPIVVPIKGLGGAATQILSAPKRQDINVNGRVMKKGIEMWPVGTEQAKMTIYQRLKQEEPGRGYYHNYLGLSDEYYLQLTAEKLVTSYTDGFPRQKWIVTRPSGDNHALDCEVYAYHSALRAGIDRMSSNRLPTNVKRQGRRIISSGVKL